MQMAWGMTTEEKRQIALAKLTVRKEHLEAEAERLRGHGWEVLADAVAERARQVGGEIEVLEKLERFTK